MKLGVLFTFTIIIGDQNTFGIVSGCDVGVIAGGNNTFARYAGDQVLVGITVSFLCNIGRSEMPHILWK